MDGVYWSFGTKSDRVELRSFDCCPGDAGPPVRRPDGSRVCPEPWSHEVQTYFRQHAISDTNRFSASNDQRLLLLRDGRTIVGALVHGTQPPLPGGAFERRVEYYALRTAVQGRRLSNGEYASHALLRAGVQDMMTRHDPGERIYVTALVRPENHASRRCLERYGWSESKPLDLPDLLVYAAPLARARTALGIPTAATP